MSAAFHPAEWSYTSSIYEVNLRQYTPEGTISAFSRQMPRLREMGIDILWFMPITPISVEKRLGTLGSYYACSDYMAINPEFGTLDDFTKLVKDAHALGLKVIIDIVANHTGWDHRWTREHPEYYKRNQEGKFYDPHGWEDVIDLNYDNKELRQAMIGVMRFWIESCDVDGFRCDMAMLVPLDFWREARVALDPLKPLFWLAECEEIAYHEVFDATYTWKLLHKMEAIWRKESTLAGLGEVLNYYSSQFPADGLRVYFTTNHDENSHSGSEYERLGDTAKACAVLCATWNGLPLIYSGQEMPNYKRLKFFDRDPIEWTGRYELNDFYQSLLSLRKRNRALRAADPAGVTRRINTGADDRCFGYARTAGEDEVVVLLNFSGGWIKLDTTSWGMTGGYKDIFTLRDWKLPASIDVSPWGYAVLEKETMQSQ
ncbi:MAG TPA: alpha-amylase family glycosyl hydrolase [Puia sp.]|jgi:glycosidase|nr:alpha-amylase family glycosyl hydrolase [Puia sp.]